jgi:hypothetical protein
MDAGSFGTHAECNQFEALLCLPMAPVPLFLENGDFGTSPIFIGTLKQMWGGQILTTIGTLR